MSTKEAVIILGLVIVGALAANYIQSKWINKPATA
jgi:hypothetical protein